MQWCLLLCSSICSPSSFPADVQVVPVSWLSTQLPLGQDLPTLSCCGDNPVHGRRNNNIPGFYLLDASSSLLAPVVTTKIPRHCQIFPTGRLGEITPMRSTALEREGVLIFCAKAGFPVSEPPGKQQKLISTCHWGCPKRKCGYHMTRFFSVVCWTILKLPASQEQHLFVFFLSIQGRKHCPLQKLHFVLLLVFCLLHRRQQA